MGKSTIITIFNSYVSLPEGNLYCCNFAQEIAMGIEHSYGELPNMFFGYINFLSYHLNGDFP